MSLYRNEPVITQEPNLYEPMPTFTSLQRASYKPLSSKGFQCCHTKRRMGARGHARPSFFWYDNNKDHKICFLVTHVRLKHILMG